MAESHPSGDGSRRTTRQSGGALGAADRVFAHLQADILEARLETGTWLREESIAKTFEVSRSPVRVALGKLEEEGLVESVPYRGTVVRFSLGQQVLEVYDVRATLDGMAARLAAKRATPEAIDRMREIQARTRIAAERGEDLMALNLEFHRALREASGNELLGQILRQIDETVRRYGSSTYRRSGPGLEAVDEHDRIIDAVARGDSDRAETEATTHMRHARERRVRSLFG